MTAMEIFAWLLIGHAIADFALQTGWMAGAKQPGGKFEGEVIWPAVLASHAGIHAGAVKLATGSWVLGGRQLAGHAPRGYTRGRGRLSFKVDQAAHVGCKVLWAALA